jgi:NAD(P)-dependent dehydrogenase (short-subunit alcohol dehydrogenase family)
MDKSNHPGLPTRLDLREEPMNPTEKRTALITGASRGLGLALARELARRGWTLILDARGTEALEAARAELSKHTKVIAIPGDVADEAHRRELMEAARAHGGLDALVNNASILGPSPQPELLDYPLATLEEVYRVNVLAPLALIQAAREVLKPNARIVNVTSDAGVEAYSGWGGYGSSKAALEQLSAILAAENEQWRIYWVDPGDMQTRMHQEAFPGEDISDRPLPEESVPGFVALLEGNLPGGRYQARALNPNGTADEKRVRAFRVALTVDDFDTAARFYRDGLGFPTQEEWDRPDNRGLILNVPNATLELLDRGAAETVDRVEAGQRVSESVRLAVEVGDVEAAAATLTEHGGAVVNTVVDTPWGDRNQRLQAPDGMQLTLFQLQDHVAETEHEYANATA